MSHYSSLADTTASPPPDGGSATAVKAVALVGFSNCGKTTLICKLVSLATERGFRVAAVKHSHKMLEVDQSGKDTWRFRQAGARSVALAAPGLLQVVYGSGEDPAGETVLAALPRDADFILVEGYKHGPLPKIIFAPAGNPEAALPSFPNAIAYLSEHALPTALPVFSRNQIEAILNFILQWLKI